MENKKVENKKEEEKLVIVNKIAKSLSVVENISKKTGNPYYVVQFELVNGYKNNLFLSKELTSLIQLDLQDGLLLKDIIKSCDLVKGVAKSGNNYYAVKVTLADYSELIFMNFGVTRICDRLSK